VIKKLKRQFLETDREYGLLMELLDVYDIDAEFGSLEEKARRGKLLPENMDNYTGNAKGRASLLVEILKRGGELEYAFDFLSELLPDSLLMQEYRGKLAAANENMVEISRYLERVATNHAVGVLRTRTASYGGEDSP